MPHADAAPVTIPALPTGLAARADAYALAEAARASGFAKSWWDTAIAAEQALSPLDRDRMRTARQLAAETAVRSADDRSMGYVSFAGVSR
jgi:hypothetical protein